MLRISKNPRDWRLLIWILLLISVFGPWVFDNIYIPSEYPCSIRLRENICGKPMIGAWILIAHTNRFWLLWGVWLYVGLLASTLILEVVVLVGKRGSPATEQPGG